MAEIAVEISGERTREYALSLVDTTQNEDIHIIDELVAKELAIDDQDVYNET